MSLGETVLYHFSKCAERKHKSTLVKKRVSKRDGSRGLIFFESSYRTLEQSIIRHRLAITMIFSRNVFPSIMHQINILWSIEVSNIYQLPLRIQSRISRFTFWNWNRRRERQIYGDFSLSQKHCSHDPDCGLKLIYFKVMVIWWREWTRTWTRSSINSQITINKIALHQSKRLAHEWIEWLRTKRKRVDTNGRIYFKCDRARARREHILGASKKPPNSAVLMCESDVNLSARERKCSDCAELSNKRIPKASEPRSRFHFYAKTRIARWTET